MIRFRCYLFLLFITTLAFGQSSASNLTGSVTDKAESVPIAYAHVWVHTQDGKKTYEATVDKTGRFALALPDGYYYVLIGYSGFEPFTKSIWVHDKNKMKLTVRLGPDEKNLISN